MIVPLRCRSGDRERAEEMIHQAVKRTAVPFDHVQRLIETSQLGLWGIYDAKGQLRAAFTTNFTFAGIEVAHLGGEGVDDWIAGLVRWLELFAASNGQRGLVMHGRPGWRKYADQFGWVEVQRTFMKGIT